MCFNRTFPDSAHPKSETHPRLTPRRERECGEKHWSDCVFYKVPEGETREEWGKKMMDIHKRGNRASNADRWFVQHTCLVCGKEGEPGKDLFGCRGSHPDPIPHLCEPCWRGNFSDCAGCVKEGFSELGASFVYADGATVDKPRTESTLYECNGKLRVLCPQHWSCPQNGERNVCSSCGEWFCLTHDGWMQTEECEVSDCHEGFCPDCISAGEVQLVASESGDTGWVCKFHEPEDYPENYKAVRSKRKVEV